MVLPQEKIWSGLDSCLVKEQIRKLLDKRAIQKCDPVAGQFISKIFLVPKPDGSHRLILNLKLLNEFIIKEHFKLEDHKTVLNMLEQNSFLATIDLKDAYYLVRIRKPDRKYLRFYFDGNLYEFSCLPFGLSTAPYTFTKIMKPVVGYLRSRGFVSVLYLDDFLFIPLIERAWKI